MEEDRRKAEDGGDRGRRRWRTEDMEAEGRRRRRTGKCAKWRALCQCVMPVGHDEVTDVS
jgi:hypothetical protein